jgi:glucose-6-phosphate 1-dehydrogenase
MSTNEVPRPENHIVVLFGATGDLAKRKLLPGWFHLYAAGLLPKEFRLIGSAPPEVAMTDEQFREHARQSCDDFCITKPEDSLWSEFVANLSFAAAGTGEVADLAAAVQRAEKEIGGTPGRLYHLAVPPVAFTSVVGFLGESGLARGARVIIEKPFGTDLDSARKLNQAVHAVFDESQVFRIDHFLGKESVDNILAFRFANGLFEPVWNRFHLRYVQIDVPETLSIEGRAAFYDATGAYRDMIVTHLFQVLAFVAMEPPVSLSARHLRDEKEKVFEALRPIDTEHVVRGQYEGYLSESGVAPGSQTETLAVVRAEVCNWRWQGVPFFLRSGKSMGASRQVVTLGFHEPPLRMFPAHRRDVPTGRMDEIVIDFADPGSIKTEFLAKVPGPELTLGHAEMAFDYKDSFAASHALEGYEHLILLAMIGDQSLFTRSDGIERLWEISEPLLENPPPAEPYAKGSWGPPSVDRLIAPYRWHLPESVLSRSPPGRCDALPSLVAPSSRLGVCGENTVQAVPRPFGSRGGLAQALVSWRMDKRPRDITPIRCARRTTELS